jgi:hypothetical protein
MTRKLTRSERARRDWWKSVAALAFIATATIVLGAWAVTSRVTLNPDTLCEVGRPLEGKIKVLVDKTDFPTPTMVAALVGGLKRIVEESVPNKLVSIYLISGNGTDSIRPIFNKCNPKLARGRAWWDMTWLVTNGGHTDKLSDEQFAKPLATLLERELLAPIESKQSAILESIDLALWDQGFGDEVADRRLIIVSDLMENMPGNSHYKAKPNLEKFLTSALGKQLQQKAWRGVRVDLVYLPEIGGHQGVDHIKFWTELFSRLGATTAVLPPFAGMNTGT